MGIPACFAFVTFAVLRFFSRIFGGSEHFRVGTAAPKH